MKAYASHCECPRGDTSSERANRARRAARRWQSVGALVHSVRTQLRGQEVMLVALMAYGSHYDCPQGGTSSERGDRAREAA